MLNKHEIVYNFKQSDITDQAVVNEKISALKPKVIYHCAGYTAVDKAEDVVKDHDKLIVVNDQFGCPTWTRILAEFMTYLVDQDQPFGIYQLSNEGTCSWYEFATEILKNKGVEVAPVDSSVYPAKSYCPHHSVMSLKKAKDTGFEIMDWKVALGEFIGEIKRQNEI